ncbi:MULTISPECIES: hypothetical protein [unclassified Frankia]
MNSARTAERRWLLHRMLAPHRRVRAVREFDEVYRTLRETAPASGTPVFRPRPGRGAYLAAPFHL